MADMTIHVNIDKDEYIEEPLYLYLMLSEVQVHLSAAEDGCNAKEFTSIGMKGSNSLIAHLQ